MTKKTTPPISSRKKPSQARSTQLVSDILEAASQVLAEEGAEAFTTSRVAERAGVSVGSLYQYFPNRASLLFRLQSDEWRQNGARLRELLTASSLPPLERLRQFVRSFVRSECEEVGLRQALGEAAPGYRDEEPQEPRVESTVAIETFLLELLPGVPPERQTRARELVMMTFGKVGKAISERHFSRETADEYAEELADMLCGYLERLECQARTPSHS